MEGNKEVTYDQIASMTQEEAMARLKELTGQGEEDILKNIKTKIDATLKGKEGELGEVDPVAEMLGTSEEAIKLAKKYEKLSQDELENEYFKVTGKKIDDYDSPIDARNDLLYGGGIQEQPKDIKDMSATERIGRAWDMSWGSLKASMGGGFEFLGVEKGLEGLEAFGKKWKEEGNKEVMDNYMPSKEFEFEDIFTLDFWTDKAPTVLPSALSLMAPSMVAGIGGAAATEASLAWLWPAAILEPTFGGEAVLGLAGLVGGAVSASMVSRGLESAMEAGGAWNEALDKLQSEVNPLTGEKYTEKEAQKLAAIVGYEVMTKNWALAGMDALEFAIMLAPVKGLGSISRGLAKKLSNYRYYTKGVKTQMPKGFRDTFSNGAKKIGSNREVLTRVAATLPKGVTVTSSMVANMAMESAEEGYQAYIEGNAMRQLEGRPKMTWDEFIEQPETKEAMVLGAVGGLFFQSVGESLGAIKKSVSEKEKEIRTARTVRLDSYQRVLSRLARASTEAEKSEVMTDYAREIASRYVGEGKTEVIKNELDLAKRKNKITEEQHASLTEHVSVLDKNYKLLPTDLKRKQKTAAVQTISGISMMEIKIKEAKAKAKENGVELTSQSHISLMEEELKALKDRFEMIIGTKDPSEGADNVTQKTEETAQETEEEISNEEDTGSGFSFTVKEESTESKLETLKQTSSAYDKALNDIYNDLVNSKQMTREEAENSIEGQERTEPYRAKKAEIEFEIQQLEAQKQQEDELQSAVKETDAQLEDQSATNEEIWENKINYGEKKVPSEKQSMSFEFMSKGQVGYDKEGNKYEVTEKEPVSGTISGEKVTYKKNNKEQEPIVFGTDDTNEEASLELFRERQDKTTITIKEDDTVSPDAMDEAEIVEATQEEESDEMAENAEPVTDDTVIRNNKREIPTIASVRRKKPMTIGNNKGKVAPSNVEVSTDVRGEVETFKITVSPRYKGNVITGWDIYVNAMQGDPLTEFTEYNLTDEQAEHHIDFLETFLLGKDETAMPEDEARIERNKTTKAKIQGGEKQKTYTDTKSKNKISAKDALNIALIKTKEFFNKDGSKKLVEEKDSETGVSYYYKGDGKNWRDRKLRVSNWTSDKGSINSIAATTGSKIGTALDDLFREVVSGTITIENAKSKYKDFFIERTIEGQKTQKDLLFPEEAQFLRAVKKIVSWKAAMEEAGYTLMSDEIILSTDTPIIHNGHKYGGIAGTPDIIAMKGNKIHIVDLKTFRNGMKDFRRTEFNEKTEENKFLKYSKQQNMYKFLFEETTGAPGIVTRVSLSPWKVAYRNGNFSLQNGEFYMLTSSSLPIYTSDVYDRYTKEEILEKIKDGSLFLTDQQIIDNGGIPLGKKEVPENKMSPAKIIQSIIQLFKKDGDTYSHYKTSETTLDKMTDNGKIRPALKDNPIEVGNILALKSEKVGSTLDVSVHNSTGLVGYLPSSFEDKASINVLLENEAQMFAVVVKKEDGKVGLQFIMRAPSESGTFKNKTDVLTSLQNRIEKKKEEWEKIRKELSDELKKGRGNLSANPVAHMAKVGYYLIKLGVKRLEQWMLQMKRIFKTATDKELALAWAMANANNKTTEKALKEKKKIESDNELLPEFLEEEEKVTSGGIMADGEQRAEAMDAIARKIYSPLLDEMSDQEIQEMLYNLTHSSEYREGTKEIKEGAKEITLKVRDDILTGEKSELLQEAPVDSDMQIGEKRRFIVFGSVIALEYEGLKKVNEVQMHSYKVVDPSDQVEVMYEMISKLAKMGPNGKKLADFLGGRVNDSDLIELLVIMKNRTASPAMMGYRKSESNAYSLIVQNAKNIGAAMVIGNAERALAGISDAELKQKYQDHIRERGILASKALRGEVDKMAIHDLDMAFMKEITGTDWTNFNSSSKTYLKQTVTLNNGKPAYDSIDKGYTTYAEKWENSDLHLNRNGQPPMTPALNFVGTFANHGKKYLMEFIGKNMNNLLKASIPNPHEMGYRASYNSASGNYKSSLEIDSSLSSRIKEMHIAEGQWVDGLDNVKFWKEKGRAPRTTIIGDIKDRGKNETSEAGQFSPYDLAWLSLVAYNDKKLSDSDTFLAPIEQFGDKKQFRLMESQKRSLSEAIAEYNRLRKTSLGQKGGLPSGSEMNAHIEETLVPLVRRLKNKKIITIPENMQILDFAREFALNFAISKFWNDQYLFGKIGTFDDYITQVKRAGSSVSPGMVPNLAITGEDFNHVIIDDVKLNLLLGNQDLGESEVTDGQTFVLPEFSNKIYEAYGSMNYESSLKGIYHEIDNNNGDMILIKSHAIVLTPELIERQPNLKAVYDMMVENKAHMVSFKSGVKSSKEYKKEHGTETKFSKDGKTIVGFGEIKINKRKFKHYRMQLNLVHDEALKPRKLTVQFMRHLLQFEESKEIVEEMSKTFNINYERFKEQILNCNEEDFTALILKNIKDTEKNRDKREMIANDVSILHPFVESYVRSITATMFERNVLEKKGNGGLYTSISLPGAVSDPNDPTSHLKPYRIVNGKALPAEVLVPENSGMKIGQKLFSTRVPSSDLHNSTYAVVVGFLPKSMVNTIVMPNEMVKIGGEDFDGDQRYVWTKYDKKYTPGVSKDEKKAVNKAFDVTEKIYKNTAYYDRLTKAINPDRYESDNSDRDQDTIDVMKKDVQPENKYFLTGLIDAYTRNILGKGALSIIARNTGVYSWIKKFNISFAEGVSVPVLDKNGNFTGVFQTTDPDTSSSIHDENADLINQATDNAKLGNLPFLGINMDNANIYMGINTFGITDDNKKVVRLKRHQVVSFLRLPILEKFYRFKEEHKSPALGNNAQNVYDAFAERITLNYPNLRGEWASIKNKPVRNIEALFSGKMTVQKELKILKLYKMLEEQFNIYNDLGKAIKTNEEMVKTFSDLYALRSTIEKIKTTYPQDVYLQELFHSEEWGITEAVMSVLDNVFARTIMGTHFASQVISSFEMQKAEINNAKKNKDGSLSPQRLSTDEVKALEYAITNMAVREALNINGSLSKYSAQAKARLNSLQKEMPSNAFLASLTISENKVINQHSHGHPENIAEIRKAFNELSNADQVLFARYNTLEHGFIDSPGNGSFAGLMSIEFHKKLGKKLDELHTVWSITNANINSQTIDSIMAKYPVTIPKATSTTFIETGQGGVYQLFQTRYIDGQKITTLASNSTYPRFIRFNRPFDNTTVEYVFERSKDANGEYRYLTSQSQPYTQFNSDLNAPSQIDGSENTSTEDDSVIKPQEMLDVSDQKPLMEDKQYMDWIMENLAKNYPGIKVFQDREAFLAYVAKHVGDGKAVLSLEALGAAFGNAIFIDPSRAVQTTPLHEMAHIYFDAISDENFKAKMLDFFDGNEEVMIEAIAMAAKDKVHANISKSRIDQFMQLLKEFWSKLKILFTEGLGIKVATKEDYTRIMAKNVLTSDGFSLNKLHNQVMIKEQRPVAKIDPNKAIIDAAYIVNRVNEYNKTEYTSIDQVDRKSFFNAMMKEDVGNIKSGDEDISLIGKIHQSRTGNDNYIRIDGTTDPAPQGTVQQWFSSQNHSVKWTELSEEAQEIELNKFNTYHDDFNYAYHDILPDYNSIDKVVDKLSEQDGEWDLIRAIHMLETKDKQATEDIRALLSQFASYNYLFENIQKEIGQDHRPFTSASSKIISGISVLDLENKDVGTWSLMSQTGIKDKIAQSRQHMRQETNDRIMLQQEAAVNQLQELQKIAEKLGKKAGIKPEELWKRVYYKDYQDDAKSTFIERIHRHILGNDKLSQALNDFVQAYHKIVDEKETFSEFKGEHRLPIANADYPELLVRYKYNLWKVIKIKNGFDRSFDSVHIHHPITGQILKLREYRLELEKEAGNNPIAFVKAKLKYRKQVKIIEQKLEKGYPLDAANIMIEFDDKKGIPLGVKFSRDQGTSEKIPEGMVRYARNLIAQHEWTASLPYHNFLKDYIGRKGGTNYLKFLEMHDNQILYGKSPKSMFGPGGGEMVQAVLNWTALKFLVFNPGAAFINLAVGVTNSYVHLGPRIMFTAMKRMVKSIRSDGFKGKITKNMLYSKFVNILDKYEVVHTSADTEISMATRTLNRAKNLSFSLISVVETFNYGLTFIGMMEAEEYEAFDSNSELLKKGTKAYDNYVRKWGKAPKELSSARISELKDKAKEINGAYDPMNKRGINYTPEGRMIMQFKNWLPDLWLAHFQKETETMNGLIKKGIVTSNIDAIPKLVKSLFSLSPSKMRKTWEEMSEIDKINVKKGLRELQVIGMLALASSALFDDDKSKSIHDRLVRTMGDFAYIYNIDNAIYLLEGPASWATIKDILSLVKELINVLRGNPSVYKRDARFGKKGEWKIGMSIQNNLPAQAVLKMLDEETKVNQMPSFYKDFEKVK
jgi:hypothetical protein